MVAIQEKRSAEVPLQGKAKKPCLGKVKQLKNPSTKQNKVDISDDVQSLTDMQPMFGISPQDVQTLVTMESQWCQQNNIVHDNNSSRLFADNVFKMLQVIKTRKAKMTKQNSQQTSDPATTDKPQRPTYGRFWQETFIAPAVEFDGCKIETTGSFMNSKCPIAERSSTNPSLDHRLANLACEAKALKQVKPAKRRLIRYHRYKQEKFIQRSPDFDGFKIDTEGSFFNLFCATVDISYVFGRPIMIPKTLSSKY